MIMNCVCSRIKTVILAFLNLFKRALCIANRRKPSLTDFEPLNSINVVRTGKSHAERDWNTWDDSPRTVEEHIEQYRERLAKPPTPSEVVQEVDFFQDMTPRTFEQPQLIIATEDPASSVAEQNNFSRLQAETLVIPVTNELKDWEELEQQQGWEEVDDESTKQLIREKRKELRHQQRQHQRQ